MSDNRLESLFQALTDLRLRFAELSSRTNEAAQNLREPGVAPSYELLADLSACHAALDELLQKTVVLAQNTMTPTEIAEPRAESLNDIEAILSRVAESISQYDTNEQLLNGALDLIDYVLALMHRDHSHFGPLVDCQTQARQLRLDVKEVLLPMLHPEVPVLVEGEHPLSSLVALVERANDLSDDQADRLQGAVSNTYGSVLAVAALRGKLVVVSDHSIPPSSPTDKESKEGQSTEPTASTPDGSVSSPSTQTWPSEIWQEPSEEPDEGNATHSATELNASLQITMIDQSEASSAFAQPGPGIAVMPNDAVTPAPSPVLTKAEGPETINEYVYKSQIAAIDQPSQPGEATVEPKAPPKISRKKPEYGKTVAASAVPMEIENALTIDNRAIMPGVTSSVVASALLRSEVSISPQQVGQLIWLLIQEDRLALAYQWARFGESGFIEKADIVPSNLLRALVISRHVRYDIGDLSSLLKSDFASISATMLVGSNRYWTDAAAFLLCAAALRPSILVPTSESWLKLQELANLGLPELEELQGFREYCKCVEQFGSQRIPLDFVTLRDVKSEESWQQEMLGLQREVAEWCDQAPRRTMAYDQATKVWQQWQKENGLISRLLRPVLENDTTGLEFVRIEAKRLSDHQRLQQEINHTDRKVLGRTRGEEIGYKALSALRQHTLQAVQLARRWIELVESQPDPRHDYYRRLVEDFRKNILALNQQASTELDEIASPVTHSPLELAAGAIVCRRVLEELKHLLADDADLPTTEPETKHLLNFVLLADPEIDTEDNWEPRDFSDVLAPALLNLTTTSVIDWEQALNARSEMRDHEGTARIIEYLRQYPDTAINVEALEELRDRHLSEARLTLRRVTEDAQKQVESAVADGLLQEDERSAYASKIQSIQHNVSRTLRIFESLKELRRIEEELLARRSRQIKAVRQRMRSAGIDEDHAAFERITRVIEAGDSLTAHEYIDMVDKGLPLPEAQTQADAFQRFFPNGLNDIDHYLAGRFADRERQVIQEIRNYASGAVRRYSLGPVDMYGVYGNQARQVADMLEAWFALKKSEQPNIGQIQTVLDGLGFRTLSVSRIPGGKQTWIGFQAEELRSREDQCPVWQYGSGAHGKYRLMCVWDRRTEQDLLTDIGDTTHGDPIVVFWFGRMTEFRRRELAQLSRQRQKTCLVIDDTLLVYLCGFPPSRLPVMFACTLPFTPLQPYTTTASIVPPEIFYGRRRERNLIIDPMGSCFVYGGRQLGKTALLRDVERNYHNPEIGFVVLWLDLKVEGIGYDRSIDEVWNLLARKLKEHGVIPSNVPAHSGVDTIIGHIEKWLEQDTGRRILILLDEADRFLESDGKLAGAEFKHASRIKGLMDRTNRRFKVVFAGLHNVQRTTRQENHPLAHYGDAICVGPLLDGGEWREARNLIEQPLSSIGYRFESPDLVTLILSQTNYYPSLIQLYCAQLLANLSNHTTASFDPKSSPPYVITAKHVNDVYQNPSLRRNVRQRFDLTLQLDQRYEVIALAVAYHSLEADGLALVDGFPVSWLRKEALYWWTEGFQDSSSDDAIRALADEMIGLGVLREATKKGMYALRSPNVLLLMGSRDDIEPQLLRKREPPVEYEPATFRSAFRFSDGEQSVDLSRRSPLTAQQESEFRSRSNAVSILFGNNAAGLRDVEPFLSLTFGPEYYHLVNKVRDITGFGRALENLDKRQKEGTTLVLVTSTCPWTLSWINKGLETVHHLRSKSSFVRIAFVADPSTTWNLLTEIEGQIDSLASEGLTLFSLHPWHDRALRQWLEDCGFGPRDEAQRARITNVTGNWPWLLQRFYDGSRSDPTSWQQALDALDKDLSQKQTARDMLLVMGLNSSDVRRILREMRDWGDAILPEELVELNADVPPERIHQTLQWADLLSLVSPSRQGAWTINPILARVLSSAEG